MPWKAAAVLLTYALGMLVLGVLTMLVAPPPTSKAVTSLIVTGVFAALAIACALMALRMESSRRIGMIGVHLGLLLPLLAAGGSGFMISKGMAGASEVGRHVGAINKALADDGRALIVGVDGAGAATAQLEATGATVVVPKKPGIRPSAYKIVSQGAVVSLSLVTLVSLLLLRPKPGAPTGDPPASA